MEPARLTKLPALFSSVLGRKRGDWFSLRARKYISVFCCEAGGLLFTLSILRILTVNTGHGPGYVQLSNEKKEELLLVTRRKIFSCIYILLQGSEK